MFGRPLGLLLLCAGLKGLIRADKATKCFDDLSGYKCLVAVEHVRDILK